MRGLCAGWRFMTDPFFGEGSAPLDLIDDLPRARPRAQIEEAARQVIEASHAVMWVGGRPHLLTPQNLMARLRDALDG